jgi:hypothetical protein
VSAACSRAPRAGDRPASSSQLITADEIARSQAVNGYDAVQKLRANFLSNRGKTSILDRDAPESPTVYLDGMQYGPIASLRNIPANQIARIRLYRAWEASTKFGAYNSAGVIEVISKTQ